ncbi:MULTISPECIES: DUF4139 domain-containing protein [Rhizobium]|uniref:DUF4139 domain-containing protein n=1 Tax=Rhizobium tropici TaxID=398 RepID=A0A6P1C5G2_RHITR|nr:MULTISPECIES: DUF4139 domain-containing protein [Rhizobium]AGB70837.1 hypothetical protein RTCIAT899_CH07170 [Rhizobium tropici CIAT 899]MBB4242573.1 hypothetical protein [Rhizobium tropici]MBB5594216.1 hypothetical protein [Rhizobium tropici]MBB6492663.1 hypothetical protein [Rhizobium tropici]NEV11636.1 DUF4139 domain-containing protein [Rhizobium tropici]
MLKQVTAILLLSAAFPAIVLAADNGAIRSITLSSGGLAQVSRSADINSDGVIRIEVPLDQVDDILKSLVVNGSAGSVAGMSLAGPQPLQETFKGLPFTPEALSSVPSLLTSLQGARVSVTSGGKTVEGNILGIETRKAGDKAAAYLLTVIDRDGAVETLALGEDASVRLEDAELRAKIAKAAAAIAHGKNDRTRTIDIKVNGVKDGSAVGLTYVVPSPIWKTAYKVVIDEKNRARLQAWTVLENASGEDWKGVKVTLTSAEPVTLKQGLHQLYWRERQEVPVNTASNMVPDADSGDLSNRQRLASSTAAPAPAGAMRPAAKRIAGEPAYEADELARLAEPMQVAAGNPTTVTESDISATFELPGTYDLANGDTLSVPIMDADVEADMVDMYRAGSAYRNPIAAVMLKNSTGVSVPAGILTLYDSKTGYIGDSQLSALPKEDTRLASFATDRKVSISEQQTPTEEIASLKVSDGMMNATVKYRQTTTYTVSGALDGERTVIIEHPMRDGWSFSSAESFGKTATHQRLKAVVPAGTEKVLTAVDEQLQSSSYALVDAEPDMLLGWSASAHDKALTDKLTSLADARKRQVAVQNDLERLDSEIEKTTSEQERIRQNLGAVPDNSDLKKRYLKALANSEDQIAAMNERRDAVQAESDRRGDDVAEIIRTF